MKTAAQAAATWAQRLSQSTQQITDGVNAVTVSPGLAAAAQSDAWLQNVTAAAPKWKKAVAAIDVNDWKAKTIAKGIPAIAAGANAAQPDFEQFMNKLLPFVSSAVNALPPRGNLEANIARSAAFQRKMATFSKN